MNKGMIFTYHESMINPIEGYEIEATLILFFLLFILFLIRKNMSRQKFVENKEGFILTSLKNFNKRVKMAQLYLFEEIQQDSYERRIEDLEKRYENLRKGQYAKITKLQSEVKSLIEQMEFLQSNIARKGYYL